MQLELQRHGHRPTQLLYTDNPRGKTVCTLEVHIN
jgi:hypothetical protein